MSWYFVAQPIHYSQANAIKNHPWRQVRLEYLRITKTNEPQILEDENVPPPNKDQGYLLENFPPNKILGYCPAGIPRNPENIESSHTKIC